MALGKNRSVGVWHSRLGTDWVELFFGSPMIERYTIKFGPAVSQKEVEKLLHAGEARLNPAEFQEDEGGSRSSRTSIIKKILTALEEIRHH